MSGQAASGPRVSVIVVNYNGGDKVMAALASLAPEGSVSREVLVVDNQSRDGSDRRIEEAYAGQRWLTLVRSDTNLGYAGGVNLALPRARGEYVAVLNMDLTVEPDWLAPLVTFMDTHPEVGAVNPLIALRDGQHVNALGQSVHITGLGFNRGLGREVAEVPREPLRVSGLHGAAFLVRRKLLVELGGMDASGFLYHEDVNLSWLLQLAGHTLYCVPMSVVRHDYFLSMSPDKLHLLERNRWAMLLAYLKPTTAALLVPALATTEGMVWGFCLLRGSAFLKAKFRTLPWLATRRHAIQERRRLAERVRKRSDWQLLRQLSWGYAWDQFVTLGKERGRSRRQPAGGFRTEAGRD